MDSVKLAIVGVGGMGKAHVKMAAEAEEVRLVAVCDIVEEAAKKSGEELGIPWYKDLQEMLKKESPDGVLLATPHFAHFSQAMECLSAGAHVLVEKPIALTVGEADQMIEEARRRKLTLAVGHNYRVGATTRSIGQLIHTGSMGPLIRMLWSFNHHRNAAYYRAGTWRGTWKSEGGGILINQAVHHLDLVSWLFGPVETVSAITDNLLHPQIEVEDIASASLRFKSGAVGTLQFGLVSIPGVERIEMIFDRGAIFIEDDKARLARFACSLKEYISNDGERPQPEWGELPPAEPWAPGSMVRDFAQAIQQGRKPLVSGEEGRAALELANAITFSSLRKRTVDLPLDRGEFDALMKELRAGRIRV